jgi:hypothetical protein
MTSLFYRRFWPEDVDATVAYVAPILKEGGDMRFAEFLAQVSTEACRTDMLAFQRAALTKKEEILALIAGDSAMRQWSFDVLGAERAFEFAVLDLPFAVWQYYDASVCDLIPESDASAGDLYGFVDSIGMIDMGADWSVTTYAPFNYQQGTELGWYGYNHDLDDLMKFEGEDNPTVLAAPLGVDMTYDPDVMADVLDWVSKSGERLMFVYGENDPWTAGRVELGDATDSYSYTQPQGNHYSGILGLEATDQQKAFDALERWFHVKVTLPPVQKSRGHAAPQPWPQERLRPRL